MKQINKKYNLSELNRVLFYILVILNLYILSIINLHADQKKPKEFNYNIMGKTIRDEKINFLSGSKFVSFKHEGGFDTNIGRYGLYHCSGSMFYSDKEVLEDMTFACEFKDQLGEKFYSRGNRIKGSQSDRSIGKMKIFEGEGYWKSYEGSSCTYGLEYVEKIIFVSAKCN